MFELFSITLFRGQSSKDFFILELYMKLYMSALVTYKMFLPVELFDDMCV